MPVALAAGLKRVLVLLPRTDATPPALPDFGSECQTVVVHTFDDAVAALRDHEFDAVFSQIGDFLALERAAVNQQAAYILETLGEGVCVMDLSGKIVWHNHHLLHCPDDLVDKVCAYVRDYAKASGGAIEERSIRLNLPSANRRSYEVHLNPIIDNDGQLNRVAAVIEDASEAQRLRQRIDAIDAAGRELVSFERDSKLTVPARLEMLESRILKFVRDVLKYDKFCIRTLDKRENRLSMLCSLGLSEQGVNLELYALPEGNGISGYVAATGQSYICADVSKDPRYRIGIHNARSSLTVPLKLHDRVIGVFNVESDQLAAFDEADRQFAEIFGRYIAMALDILDLMVFERYASSGQLAEDVAKELSTPLNDIQAEAQSLVDDYIGNDELRRRLGTIIRHLNEIRATVKQVTDPEHALAVGSAKPAAHDPLLGGKHILVADDNDMLRETIADVLTKYGCTVSVAANGNEASDLLDRERFDLVLADIKMPGKNGYEIFAQARTVSAALPVILMTGFGYDPNHSIVKASKEGLSGVLFKPFKTEQLLDDIRAALQKAAAGPS